jgi:hypothetical protein
METLHWKRTAADCPSPPVEWTEAAPADVGLDGTRSRRSRTASGAASFRASIRSSSSLTGSSSSSATSRARTRSGAIRGAASSSGPRPSTTSVRSRSRSRVPSSASRTAKARSPTSTSRSRSSSPGEGPRGGARRPHAAARAHDDGGAVVGRAQPPVLGSAQRRERAMARERPARARALPRAGGTAKLAAGAASRSFAHESRRADVRCVPGWPGSSDLAPA